MNCNPQALLQAAACYRCIPKPVMRASMISLLCEWANHLTPPPVECGTPSDVILISGAGNAGMNGTYIHDLANPNIWQSVDNAQARIRIFAGTAILEFGLAAFERYTTPIALFPCTWSLGVDGTDPVPTGMYLDAPPIAWTPTTEPATWTDMNGVHVGDLANFQANAHTATISDITFGATGFLTNIVGLGNLPSLATLDVSGNALVALDLTNCASLTTLNCSSNATLTTLMLTGCAALTALDLTTGMGGLVTVNVQGCTSLTTLNTTFNSSLANLNVTGCTALFDLACSDNSLTSLDLSTCSAMLYLDCGFGAITSLDLSGCPLIVSASVQENPLNSLNLSGCTSLDLLAARTTNLASIDLSSCTSLTNVDLEFNANLTSLDLTAQASLSILYCISCNLTGTLDLSPCTALTHCECGTNPNMTAVNVSGCVLLNEFYGNTSALASSNVDSILVFLDGTGLINGVVNLSAQAPAAPPGPAGAAAKTSLQGKGWTVLTD